MKCHAIQTIDGSVAQEILILALGKICCGKKPGGELRRSPASTTEKDSDSLIGLRSEYAAYSLIQRAKSVATSNFTRDVEILLAELGSTLPSRGSPLCQSVNSDLCRFIDANGVYIKSLNDQARKNLKLGHDTGFPFTKTVLHRCELG